MYDEQNDHIVYERRYKPNGYACERWQVKHTRVRRAVAAFRIAHHIQYEIMLRDRS